MTVNTSPRFSIGEVSQAVGVAPQTIRLWEKEGLIEPERTEVGYRVYDEADLGRLREIKRMRQLEGLNFAAIRKQSDWTRAMPHSNRSDVSSSRRRTGTPENQLRRLRLKARKTLKEVSEATELSISFISALERGTSGASVASMRRLAEAYGLTMRELFGVDLESSSLLVRQEDRPLMRWENGVCFEQMASGERLMDPSYIKLPSGSGSEGFYSHDGEEFVYVISGVLSVELKGQGTYAVRQGDTLYFSSTTPHRWWAEKEPVEAIYVNTPPSF